MYYSFKLSHFFFSFSPLIHTFLITHAPYQRQSTRNGLGGSESCQQQMGTEAYQSIKESMHVYILSHVQLSAIPWTMACQVPLSMGFSRQEYWSGVPFPSPGDLPDPGIEPLSPESPAMAGRFFTTEPPGKPKRKHTRMYSEM